MKYVTRNVKFCTVTCVGVNKEKKEVQSVQIVLESVPKSEKKLLALCQQKIGDNISISYIEKTESNDKLMGVPFEVYMKNAIPMKDFRTPL